MKVFTRKKYLCVRPAEGTDKYLKLIWTIKNRAQSNSVEDSNQLLRLNKFKMSLSSPTLHVQDFLG